MRTIEKAILIMPVEKIEIKTIRKRVNNPAFRSKLRIKEIKRRKDFIKSIIHVNNWAFNQLALVFCKNFE